MKSTFIILMFITVGYATQWQPAEPLYGIDIGDFNLNSDNNVLYGDKWHDGYWMGDIGYYTWNGVSWVWEDWVQGDVNSTEYDIEPFITYDGQHLYFERWGSYNPRLYVADWNGSAFVNSRQLNSNINQGNSRFPSITQDMNYLYFTKSGWIYVSEWNGLDWGVPIILPVEVNGGGGLSRNYVTITPDGNEIYFTGAGSYTNRLAFSHKTGGVWQQWQYCDYNINPPSDPTIASPAFTYSVYATQYMYFARDIAPYVYRSLRSPVSVEPASIGQIKANYAR
jgi:hypothetical protein